MTFVTTRFSAYRPIKVVAMATYAAWMVFLPGCVGPSARRPQFSDSESYRPRTGILYYPVGRCQDRTISRPMPDYRGWTNERMARDLRRIHAAEIDFVVTVIELDQLNDFYLQRLAEFVDIGHHLGPEAPKIAFCLLSFQQKYDQRKMLMFLEWMIDSGQVEQDGYFRLGGKPLVILGPGMEPYNERHPAFSFRRAFSATSEWAWGGNGEFPWSAVTGRSPEQAFVRAGRALVRGNRPGYHWDIPRHRGRTLRNGLWDAAGKRAAIILISSWNDFSSGDFVEPNDLDQERLYRVLQREIPRLPSPQ